MFVILVQVFLQTFKCGNRYNRSLHGRASCRQLNTVSQLQGKLKQNHGSFYIEIRRVCLYDVFHAKFTFGDIVNWDCARHLELHCMLNANFILKGI